VTKLDKIRPANDIGALSGVKLFADGASLTDFTRLYASGQAAGFTTNPTLMHKAQITDYEGFARTLLARIPDLPISFEVFSDEFDEMKRQARKIASWAANVYVKIPITNTRGDSSLPMVRELAAEGVKVNVTAILTLDQVAGAVDALNADVPAIISVFAGRIADTGRDPVPVMRAAVALASLTPKTEVLWASLREVFNIHQARDCGCHIITATPDILKKLELTGKDLGELSRETVAMFHRDAIAAGFSL
jgi:transaldolase